MVHFGPMKLDDLTKDERTALGRLVHLVVRIDGGLSTAEREQIDDVAAELGEDLFWDIIDAARKCTWNFAKCIRAVERQPTRELIYGVLLGIAMVGTLEPTEQDILDRVAAAWEVEDVPEPPDDDFDDDLDEDEEEDEEEEGRGYGSRISCFEFRTSLIP